MSEWKYYNKQLQMHVKQRFHHHKYDIYSTVNSRARHGIVCIQKLVHLSLMIKGCGQRLTATPGLVRFVPRSDPSKTLIG
jgi:hypothetical protein